jgi:CRISPR system Cascade subunit CasA
MNLLTDPIFRVQTANGIERFNLPALLTALGRDEVIYLPGLQRHQEDAFHIFLCYLAAAVLNHQGADDPKQDESFWRDGIRQLTGRDDDDAWTLVVDDVTRPAFMQAMFKRQSDAANLKRNAATPDELDILPTAKNHDIKTARAADPAPDEWVYALVSLQTMSGFFGRGNYGIARMNGGFASRLCVELMVSNTPGGRWQRAIKKLSIVRLELLTSPWPYRADGEVLLWNQPWNGDSSLGLSSLHPFFIEIARVVRLTTTEDGIEAMGMPSKVARIEAKQQKGVLGDPWIPLNDGRRELTALTVSPAGLTPELLSKLIFEENITPAFMQKPLEEEVGRPAHLYVSVLARGKGTTDGFHTQIVPIPTKVSLALFGSTQQRDSLGKLSNKRLEQAKGMQNKVLKFALYSLLEAGPDKVDFDKREVSAWVDQAARDYTERWSRDYFEWLWRTLDHEDEEHAHIEWLISLKQKALAVLEGAMARLPERQGRRYRARVKARGTFFGSLNKQFPELKEQDHAKRTS